MEGKYGCYFQWKIDNFSHWCAEVHGECIKTLSSLNFGSFWSSMELYPKGISGQGEHLVVRLCGVKHSYSGKLSFHSSDGSLLCSEQEVKTNGNKGVLELPPGPKLEDLLSRIQESGDFLTVRWWTLNFICLKKHMSTTINVFKISLKIEPSWIEKMQSEGEKQICHIGFSPENIYDGMELKACSKKNIVHFMIMPPTLIEYPFAIALCMKLTGSDGTVGNCLKKEHMFRDKSPWTFLDPLDKKKLAGKEISLILCLKTRNVIQSPFYVNLDISCISIEFNNTLCFHEKAPSTDPVLSSKVEVLTKDSGSHTSLTFNVPDDSVQVLSKELMCLFQDQDFSDITLKCGDVTFPVHKNILSARSPVFKTMLSTDMAEAASGQVDIGDLDPSTLSRFLTYLYTGALEEELQCERALKLYYAADKYQVPTLKRDCLKFLCDNVSISNVCDILSLADKHRDDELTAASHSFILDNFNTVLKSKEWDTLKKNEPLLVAETVTKFAVEDRVVRKDQHQ